jgi:chitinase
VPIFNIALGSIDGVQVQAYNNWYDGLNEGSLAYLQDVTLQWLNKPSTFCVGCSVLTNFAGIPSNKLVIGIPASTSAGSGYPLPSVLAQFITWTQTSGNSIAAMMIWDSHWDSLNNYIASNTII